MENNVNNQFLLVTIINPSDTPFELFYNDSLTRVIPAGGRLTMPLDPLGVLAKKHLIDRMCRLNKENLGDPTIRAKWEGKIVLDEGQDTPMILDANQAMQQNLDRLNKTNDSGTVVTCPIATCNTKTFNLIEHNTLNHAESETVPVTTAVSAQPPVVKTQAQLEAMALMTGAVGGQTAKVLEEQVMEENPEPQAPPPPPPAPTRQGLIDYARDTLLMDVNDATTRSKLENDPLDTLAKELNYGVI